MRSNSCGDFCEDKCGSRLSQNTNTWESRFHERFYIYIYTCNTTYNFLAILTSQNTTTDWYVCQSHGMFGSYIIQEYHPQHPRTFHLRVYSPSNSLQFCNSTFQGLPLGLRNNTHPTIGALVLNTASSCLAKCLLPALRTPLTLDSAGPGDTRRARLAGTLGCNKPLATWLGKRRKQVAANFTHCNMEQHLNFLFEHWNLSCQCSLHNP